MRHEPPLVEVFLYLQLSWMISQLISQLIYLSTYILPASQICCFFQFYITELNLDLTNLKTFPLEYPQFDKTIYFKHLIVNF